MIHGSDDWDLWRKSCGKSLLSPREARMVMETLFV